MFVQPDEKHFIFLMKIVSAFITCQIIIRFVPEQLYRVSFLNKVMVQVSVCERENIYFSNNKKKISEHFVKF
jgi:hypothetical protein